MHSSDHSVPGPNLKDAVNAFERTLIHSVLAACGWNQRKAAETLGVLATTLSEKIYRLNIRRAEGDRLDNASDRPRAKSQRARRSVPAIELAPQVTRWCPSCQGGLTGAARKGGVLSHTG